MLNIFTFCAVAQETVNIKSPNKKISVQFTLDKEGKSFYSIYNDKIIALESSKLGLIRDDEDFSKNLTLVKASKVEVVTDQYELINSKRKSNSYKANKQVIHLKNSSGKLLNIIFQVSNDGLAFRYYFPEKSSDLKKIREEITTFNFEADAKGWLQPMSEAKTGWEATNPAYEEYYEQGIAVGTPSPMKAGWVYPALFQTKNSWVLITESFPDKDYCGTRLKAQSPNGEYGIRFPDPREIMNAGALNPKSTLPWYSPWRIITVGDLKTIVESSLGTDLAKPTVAKDFSFVKTGISSWSWALLKDDSTVYHVQKKFIDYASEMKWAYCLIDTDWDRKIGREKIKELADYAKTKNVGLILWYNSSGDWNTVPYTPKNKLLNAEVRAKEFKWLKETGIKGIKVDFFGGDGQSVIDYYIDIISDAADYGIMVNCHGSTLPRGIQRTYPNLVTMESIKGLEFRTFEQINENIQATHCAMLPFSRNAFDPMDYTPMVLNKIPNIKRTTTSAFELALPVLFLSGVQHIAETPAGLAPAPEYVKTFLKNLPPSWDDVKFIDGFPGKLCVIARQYNNKWYVAGINGENLEKHLSLDLSFIKKSNGKIISDGNDSLNFSENNIQIGKATSIKVAPRSGFVIVFE